MNLTSLDAEYSVLGACILDGKLVEKLTDTLSATDFSTPETETVWRAMLRLSAQGQAIDVVTLSDQLEEDGTYQNVGGMSFIADIAKNTPSTANVFSYAEIVSDLSGRRRLMGELTNIEALANDKQRDLPAVIDDAQGRLSRLIREDADQAGPIGADLIDMVDEIDRKFNGEEGAKGLSFGLADLDRKTMGMFPGNLVVVGGRPSMGKTAFALNVLRACCVRDERPAVMFSMEMDRRALRNRMTAAVGDMPLQTLRDPKANMHDEHWVKLTCAVNSLKDAPLIIDDRAGMSPSQIRGASKRWRDHFGDLGLVVIDYLGLMRADGKHGTREQEVAEASRAMKELAKELQCPVLLLSQLNRGLEQRSNKRPIMSDLRESGAIEQDADLILFLYRDEVYDEDSPARGIAEIIIGKQREGELGTVYAGARLDHARFNDLDAGSIQQMRNPEPVAKRPRSAMAEF